MSMLAAPDTITGPLTAADLDEARAYSTGRIYRLHRVTVAGRDTCSGACETRSGCDCCAMQCPPCHGRCHQGRACNAQGASASSELLQDDEAERRMTLASWFWSTYLALLLVAVCAGIAHFLPALKALVNN